MDTEPFMSNVATGLATNVIWVGIEALIAALREIDDQDRRRVALVILLVCCGLLTGLLIAESEQQIQMNAPVVDEMSEAVRLRVNENGIPPPAPRQTEPKQLQPHIPPAPRSIPPPLFRRPACRACHVMGLPKTHRQSPRCRCSTTPPGSAGRITKNSKR